MLSPEENQISQELIDRERGWKPNIKQEPFLALPTSIKEAFYGGGAGSGKSDVLLYYPLVHQWHHNPRFKQVFARRTFPELRNEIVPRSREIYRRFGATFNKSDMAWTFPRVDQLGGTGSTNGGAVILLGHCENEDDVHKYDSMEINLFTPDELTSFTEWIYLYIGLQRTRTSDPALPAIIRSAGMPGGIGHGWVKKRFIDPYPKGGKILVGRGGIKRIFIHATQADNPYIDPNYKISLGGLPEAEKNAKLYGNFDAYLGQVFSEFRDRKYPDEPESALHVIEPFDIPSWWPRIFIGDWGYAAMNYILYGAISPDKRIYCYRERFWVKTKIEVWAPEFKEDIEREGPKVIGFCKSIMQDRGQEHTIQQQIEDAIEHPIQLANHSPGSRVAGKMLLHEYLRWEQKKATPKEMAKYSEQHAMWLVRNKGLEAYKEYLERFQPSEPETNLPRMQIFEGACPLLVGAIKACIYAKSKDGIPAEDVAEFDGDDPYDTVRYLCDSADRYFEASAKEFESVQKQDSLTQFLKDTGDMTSFYRRAALLEKKSPHQFGVSRYKKH